MSTAGDLQLVSDLCFSEASEKEMRAKPAAPRSLYNSTNPYKAQTLYHSMPRSTMFYDSMTLYDSLHMTMTFYGFLHLYKSTAFYNLL